MEKAGNEFYELWDGGHCYLRVRREKDGKMDITRWPPVMDAKKFRQISDWASSPWVNFSSVTSENFELSWSVKDDGYYDYDCKVTEKTDRVLSFSMSHGLDSYEGTFTLLENKKVMFECKYGGSPIMITVDMERLRGTSLPTYVLSAETADHEISAVLDIKR